MSSASAGASSRGSPDSVRGWPRALGRLKEQSRGVAQHYTIEVLTDESGRKATALTWKLSPARARWSPIRGSLPAQQPDRLGRESLWRTYTTLTDVEAVFRSLKSELGLRPIYHHKPVRSEGHLFLTVIAYQLVQVIRKRLKQRGDSSSWTTLRRILEGQQRVTVGVGTGGPLRKATRAETDHKAIYDGPSIPLPEGSAR